jgi:PAS domain S-box-containing protein
MISNKKILAITTLIIFFFVFLKLDVMIKYDLGLLDFYKYNASFTENEKKLLNEKPLLVGVYDKPPLAFINEFNNYNTGIVVDYLSQLAIELSSDIKLKVGSPDYLIEELNKEGLDIMLIEKSDEHIKQFDISQPLLVVKGVIIVKNDDEINKLHDLKEKTLVALVSDDVTSLIDKRFKRLNGIEIIEVDNIYECFALIRNNIAVGFIGDDMVAAHFINVTNKGLNFKSLDAVLYEKEISFAVKKGNTELLSIVNKGILAIKKKNLIPQTQYKWLGDYESDSIDLRKVSLAYKIIIGVIVIVVVFSSWNYIITQRVNTKTRELLESKEELRHIIDTMKNGIIVINDDEIIVECNDAITNFIGINREKLIGSRCDEIEAVEPFLKDENLNTVFNISNKYYYVTYQKYGSDKQLIVIEDYTNKYVSERRVRQESKMVAVGQLSAGLAHEIRNPLGLIKSYCYVIERYKEDETFDHAVNVIFDSVVRINTFIENLLRFSKLTNDDHKLVSVVNVLDNILVLEKKNFEHNKIVVKSSVTENSEKPIIMNEDVLKMILLNLINNSIDSFRDVEREVKEIRIELSVEASYLNIKVIDNGCGIEKEKLENIFNPFYSTKESGTGLGLYILSTEITNHNGYITVNSNVGEGTTFDITLKIKE